MDSAAVNPDGFRPRIEAHLPYGLRTPDFAGAMTDFYSALHAVNEAFFRLGLPRLEDQVRKATLSSLASDLMTSGLAEHSENLVVNKKHNGFPDTVPRGVYEKDSVKEGREGVEVKISRPEKNAGFDAHGAHIGWYAIFEIQQDTDEGTPTHERQPTYFSRVWLGHLAEEDFRENERPSKKGTDTASPDKDGVAKLRDALIYSHDGDFSSFAELPLEALVDGEGEGVEAETLDLAETPVVREPLD